MIDEARNKDNTVHFASFVDLCHLKILELEPQYQKYKSRVVPRGDIVKMILDRRLHLLSKDHQHHK